jgi:ACR3 family arsenite efflux pump ArsB
MFSFRQGVVRDPYGCLIAVQLLLYFHYIFIVGFVYQSGEQTRQSETRSLLQQNNFELSGTVAITVFR